MHHCMGQPPRNGQEGWTAQAAIDQIYFIYGVNLCVTHIINQMKIDLPHDCHLELMVQIRSRFLWIIGLILIVNSSLLDRPLLSSSALKIGNSCENRYFRIAIFTMSLESSIEFRTQRNLPAKRRTSRLPSVLPFWDCHCVELRTYPTGSHPGSYRK